MLQPQPIRLVRTRKAHNVTPPGGRYVGRPTIWWNPFERRKGISHARSVILFSAWIAGELNHYVLSRCGFGEDEIVAIDRLRRQLVRRLIELRGLNLQCWCAITSAWCHANILLRICNGPIGYLERLAA